MPTLSVLLAASLWCITLIGGCPQAQQPTVPQQEEPAAEEPTTTPDDDLNRPIDQPDLDDDSSGDDGGGSVTPPGGSTGGGGGGSGQSSPVIITMQQPDNPLAVRPGTIVTVAFSLLDLAGAVESGELLVARDDNADGVPDGGSLIPKFPISMSSESSNVVAFNTSLTSGLLTNGFGRFVVGVKAVTIDKKSISIYNPATITVDAIPPTASWVGAGNPPVIPLDRGDHLVNRQGTWTFQVNTTDNSPHTVRVQLDTDLDSSNSNEYELVAETAVPAGSANRSFSTGLAAFPSGTYHYLVTVSDGIEPAVVFYAENPTTDSPARLGVTNRLIGEFQLEQLTNSNYGAILQGVEFNDLAGSSISTVPDLDGDGADELVVVSRFGKPFRAYSPTNGVGFGAAYLIYGSPGRLRGQIPLNSTGTPSRPGLVFPGIRTPRNVTGDGTSIGWTAGLSDVTVVPDIDGDELYELAFSFPRVESITLGTTNPALQLSERMPDIAGMGNLEYNAMGLSWNAGKAQFTRGGIVMVSSRNTILTDRTELDRKSNRVIDLHEVGQLFNSMFRPQLVPYIKDIIGIPPVITDPPATGDCIDCDGDSAEETPTGDCGPSYDFPTQDPPAGEAVADSWLVLWDVVFNNQGPGGFLRENSFINVDPPLANVSVFPYITGVNFPFAFYPDVLPETGWCPLLDGDVACRILNDWYIWGNCLGGVEFPGGDASTCGIPSWSVPGMVPTSMWTGFYGPSSTPRVFFDTGDSFPAPVGARVLGQKVDDLFGTSVASDGTWLYICASDRTANDAPYASDVDGLEGVTRADSGVVYQLRLDTQTQLWIEPGQVWPNIDRDAPAKTDYTMPVPHSYIIDSVGSLRAQANDESLAAGTDFCPPAYDAGMGTQADNLISVTQTYPGATEFLYPPDTAGSTMDRTPQIVGPHAGAKISFVRTLGDVNDDGVGDFAVGSNQIRSDVIAGTGDIVGAVFIVYGRPSGVEGDYLLENVARPQGPDRLEGVLVKGTSAGETLGEVFDKAGDFNGDGYADVIVGNHGAPDGGEAIVIFGSRYLLSPANGWTVADVVAAGHAVRFVGESAGDLAGANVAGVGDVDGDGYDDIAIAAPGAAGEKGAVYLIYGSPDLSGEISLATIGTVTAPGAKFIGRAEQDMLGGGVKEVTGTDPTDAGRVVSASSRGVVSLGDVDGDELADFAISSMLADPNRRQDAGEVYILYGQSGP